MCQRSLRKCSSAIPYIIARQGSGLGNEWPKPTQTLPCPILPPDSLRPGPIVQRVIHHSAGCWTQQKALNGYTWVTQVFKTIVVAKKLMVGQDGEDFSGSHARQMLCQNLLCPAWTHSQRLFRAAYGEAEPSPAWLSETPGRNHSGVRLGCTWAGKKRTLITLCLTWTAIRTSKTTLSSWLLFILVWHSIVYCYDIAT